MLNLILKMQNLSDFSYLLLNIRKVLVNWNFWAHFYASNFVNRLFLQRSQAKCACCRLKGGPDTWLWGIRGEKKGNWEQKTAGSLGLGFGCWVEGDFCKGLTMCFRRPDDVFERKSRWWITDTWLLPVHLSCSGKNPAIPLGCRK